MEVTSNKSAQSRIYTNPLSRCDYETGKSYAWKTLHGGFRVVTEGCIYKGGGYISKYSSRSYSNKISVIECFKIHGNCEYRTDKQN